MARSVDEIKSAIKTDIRTYPSLDSFLFPEDGGSKVSVFNIIIFVVAAAMFTFEVIADNLKTNIQSIADRAPSGNAQWLRRQILNFQYGDSITINTTDPDADDYFVPKYAVEDDSKKIVTRCAITDDINGTVNVKVAKGTAPNLIPLTSTELTALKDYYFGTSATQGIGFAGVNANFISLNADRLYVEAKIYYFGQYIEATVKTNVIDAINDFLDSFADVNFGGKVFMIKLVDAIQKVEGVSRVELVNIKGRAATTTFANGATVSIQGVYVTAAGYIISEDSTGNTLSDSITMFEETL